MMRAGILLACAVYSVSLTVHARSWYISPDGCDISGDGTELNPYRTINRASTNTAFTAGETIYLAPGDYDEGTVEDTATSGGVTYSGFSRVLLPKAAVIDSVLGAAGAAKTRIVGQSVDDPEGSDGCGHGAVRCIHARAAGIHIRNVTLADGCTTWTNANGNADFDTQQGGAVRSVNSNVYLVNCIVTNCSGRGAAIYNATAIGCRILGGGGSSVIRSGKAFFSLFDGNAPSGAVVSYSTLVNCTVVNTASPLYQGASSYAANTIHALYSGGTGLSAVPGDNNYAVPKSEFGVLKNPFINPFEGDFRLREKDGCTIASYSSAMNGMELENLADKGDRTLLEKVSVPEQYAYTGERLHLGCFETAVQAGGGIYIDTRVLVNGGIPALTGARSFYSGFPTASPGFYRITPPGENPERLTYNFWRPATCGSGLFPEPDGSVCVLTRPDTNMMMTVSGQPVTETVFVDCNDANAADSNPGTEDAPLKTIQAAVDRVTTSHPLILVKPGIYTGTNTCAVSDGDAVRTIRAAVVITNRACAIRSTGGASVTFIKGAADPGTAGPGPDAVRCVYVKNSLSSSGQLQGFTLTGGCSDDSSSGAVCRRGAVVTGNGCDKYTVSDCIAEDCSGADSLIMNAFVKRCMIRRNTTKANLIEACYVSSSVISGNTSEGPNLLTGLGHYFGTTFYGNTCTGTIWGSHYIWFFNCLLDGNGTAGGAATDKGGNFAWNFTGSGDLPEGFERQDACLVDPENGDFRLATMSPAIDAGATAAQIRAAVSENPAVADAVTPYISTSDFSGQTPRAVDGRLTPGAMQCDFVPCVRVSCPDGGLSVEGGKEGFNPLTGEESVTISAASSGSRPCIGYLLNGVTNLFSEVPSRKITAEDLASAGGGITVEALYSTDWYVDALNGNDGNSGFLPSSAFKTLKAALSAEGLAAGDTVHVAAGEYGTETMPTEVPGSTVAASRASVPAGVTLEGESPGTTVIRGGELVRCVSLMDGSRVRNFTLTGAVLPRQETGEGSVYPGENDTGAAAALGQDGGLSVVENCIVSNNVAYRRAAGSRCVFVRCRIVDNLSDTAPAGAYSTYHHCFIDGNRGEYTAMYSSYYNTTFTPDNTAIGGGETTLAYYYSSPTFYHCWENGFRAVNSVFPGMVSTNHCYRYCALAGDVMTNGRYIDGEIAGEGSVIADKDDFVFDGSGAPVMTNPVVDACDFARVQELSGEMDSLLTDLSGAQRVWNGKIDIGCFEYDRRGDFARCLTSRRGLTVLTAAPMVIGTDDGKVRVPEGNPLKALWVSSEPVTRTYGFTVQVTGTGTLSVSVNGEVIEGLSVIGSGGVETLSFTNGLAENELEFVFTGEGYADLSAFTKTGPGFMLLVR